MVEIIFNPVTEKIEWDAFKDATNHKVVFDLKNCKRFCMETTIPT